MTDITKGTPKREYQDKSFCHLFSEKEYALSLLSAISGGIVNQNSSIELISTKSDFKSSLNNDLAYICDGKLLIMIEHQTKLSSQFGIRLLIYYVLLLMKYCSMKKFNLHSGKQIYPLKPIFFVLYHGKSMKCDSYKRKFSDYFPDEFSQEDLNFHINFINISSGYNDEIKQNCKPLQDYITLIDLINQYKKFKNLNDSIQAAIDECIKHNILREYLLKHGKGVADMLLEEFTQEDAVNLAREEGLEKGLEKGLKTGLKTGREETRESVAKRMLSLDLSLDIVAKCTELGIAELEALKAEIAG